ncbi:DUF4240 domain-containing protein [Planococcus sp. N017]|uniref:DUF4240 domain-containing protein n=1 Tax=Planococcus shenhongbingii TaxID=3058398 RepID=A0ABT8NHD0_9BACL|nr:DUF4240 domain-containing protein [Planococcus sp. N017]MDN7247129.1 DUF4240 domain-containing protein [Planococcus sp. N017]
MSLETLLVFKSSYSNKFWKISVAENSFAVTYGRIGTAGTVRVKEFPSIEACEKEAYRLIESKLKKGYQPAEKLEQVVVESTMTESSFWQLVDRCGDYGEDSLDHMEWLVSHLSKKPVLDILIFDSIFKEHYAKSYQANLWAAASIAMGGCSDDSFDYFRAWILYLGKEVYYEAIDDPESLLPYLLLLQEQEGIPQLEELLFVASSAYEEKTGQEFEEYLKLYDQLMEEDDSGLGIDLDWDEDDEEGLRNMFPTLWEAFHENPL